jgi:signal transduction histidine kinase
VLKTRSKVLLLRQKKLEQIIQERTSELKQKNEELELANQTKDKFFSIISHDLRSPFSGLLGILELLTEPASGFDMQKQTELLQTAKKSAQNTFELLENLLLWSRSQMKNTTCNIEKHDITEILRKNIAIKKQAALQKEISVIENFSDKIEAMFDKEMINTVIRNILNNAIKFTYPGGKVNISAETKNGEVKITISDTGIGITGEEMNHLFKIEKMNRAGTEGEKGTGLGLIISKEFIEKNNGKIWATTNSPSGAIFHFTLPSVQN